MVSRPIQMFSATGAYSILNASRRRLLQFSEVKFGALMKSAPVQSTRWLATGSYSQPNT